MLWRRKWQPTPVFLPGESQGRGSLVGCHLWGRTELAWLKWLSRASSGNLWLKDSSLFLGVASSRKRMQLCSSTVHIVPCMLKVIDVLYIQCPEFIIMLCKIEMLLKVIWVSKISYKYNVNVCCIICQLAGIALDLNSEELFNGQISSQL